MAVQMTARSEERARLRNALDTCRREAKNVEMWNRYAMEPVSLPSFYRKAAERCAIHAERAARAYFKGR